MKLELLITREKYLPKLEKTLYLFFKNKFNLEVDISWNKSKKFENFFFVNKRINLIFPKKINKFYIGKLSNEYRYHKKLSKKLIYSIYTSLAIGSLRSFFSSLRIYIHPLPSVLEGLIILPGNQTIKVFDIKTKSCYVVFTNNSNMDFFKNQVNIRLENEFLMAPKIISNNLKKGFYQEEWFYDFLPFDRQIDSDEKDKLLEKLQSNLLELYSKTTQRKKIYKYASELYQKIFCKLKFLPEVYSENDIKKITDIVNFIFSNLDNNFEMIDIVQTHGDFQPANIMVNISKNDILLIDWEYTDFRSRFYDALVFFLEVRTPNKIHKNILNLNNKNWRWCYKDSNKKLSKNELVVFLLEDIIVRIIEIQHINLLKISPALDLFLANIKEINFSSFK